MLYFFNENQTTQKSTEEDMNEVDEDEFEFEFELDDIMDPKNNKVNVAKILMSAASHLISS